MGAKLIYNHIFHLGPDVSVLINSFQQILGTDVGGEDNDGILKVHGPALGIRDTSIIQDLQKYVKHVRMGLLHFVKQHHAVWFAAHGLCQLSSLVVSNVSWRRSDKTRHGMLLHVLAHINPNYVGLVVKQRLGKGFGQLRLTYTGRPQEQEGSDWLGGVLDACLGTDDGLGYQLHAFILAHHTFVKNLIQMQGLASLTLCQLGNRNSGPFGYDSCNLIL